MNTKRLAEIRARLAAATPGEWGPFRRRPSVGNFWADSLPEGSLAVATGSDAGDVVVAAVTGRNPADAELIAAAPTDIADLLADVECLRAALAEAIVLADTPERLQDSDWLRRRNECVAALEAE